MKWYPISIQELTEIELRAKIANLNGKAMKIKGEVLVLKNSTKTKIYAIVFDTRRVTIPGYEEPVGYIVNRDDAPKQSKKGKSDNSSELGGTQDDADAT